MNHVGSYSALQCKGCTLVITGDNTFKNNSSLRDVGGAIQAYNGKLILFTSGNVIFSRNVGGAIYVHKSEVTCDSGATVVLDGNTAEFHGGGMYLEASPVQISRCNMKFINNVAKLTGGGLYIDLLYAKRSDSVLSGNFTNNTAEKGGAVIILNAEYITLRKVTIVSNSASALYISESTVALHTTQICDNWGEEFIQ